MENIVPSQQLSLEIKTPAGLKVIGTMNILYVEAAKKCSIIYLNDQNSVITYHLLKWFNNNLLKPYFFRCHNSYIVNCLFVDCYCNQTVTLINKKKVPLSRNRKLLFRENLKNLAEDFSVLSYDHFQLHKDLH